MHLVEILGSKSKLQNNMNFNEIALIFRHSSMPSTERNDTAFTNSSLTVIRLGFLKVVFPWDGGGVNLTPPSYFKKNLSNFNKTLYNC